MSNLQINLTTDLAPLERLVQRLQNPTPLYKAWANLLEQQTVQAFKTETAPYGGAKWAALQPATVERKQRRKSPPSKNRILRDTGTLYTTVAARATPTGAVVGTNQQVGSYSLGAIHQFGAPKRNIPARPFLPMDEQGQALPGLVEDITQLTEDFFAL